MNQRWILCGLLFASVGFVVQTANADIIYRETFPNSSTGNQELQGVGWGLHVGANAGDRSASPNAHVSNGTGKPSGAAAVANINAGNPTTAVSNGYHWGNATGAGTGDAETRRMIAWTPEYSFDPAGYMAGSLVFSWYQGNGSTTDAFRVAVQVGGQWYVSETAYTNTVAVGAGGDFFRGDDLGNGGTAHGAELKNFVFTTDASAWRQLSFDGAVGANGTVLAMAGTTLAASLPSGAIDAFGLFTNNPTNSTRRVDTFTITAQPVPEPATWLLLLSALGAVGAFARRT